MSKAPVIAHFDLDCFFVSVERVKNPYLKGKPVIVGGLPGSRAVVSSSSYEAREFGIRAAMPIAQAIRLCPNLIVVRGSFEEYERYHVKVREIVSRFSPIVEVTSIDEGYIDLTGTKRLWGSPIDTSEMIRWRIKDETGLDCSIGVASSKLVSKVATNFVKPNGVIWIKPGEEMDFLAPLQVSELPGVGPKTVEKLLYLGVETVGDLASLDPEMLERFFGVNGRYLHQAANGLDNLLIDQGCAPKQIGKEVTFQRDTTDQEFISAMLHYLVEKVCYALRKQKKLANSLIVKFRYEDFETHTVSSSFCYPMSSENRIFEIAWALLRRALTRRVGVRLIGVSVFNLVPDVQQLYIFDSDSKLRKLARAVDSIRDRFGFDSILFGESIKLVN